MELSDIHLVHYIRFVNKQKCAIKGHPKINITYLRTYNNVEQLYLTSTLQIPSNIFDV